MRRGVRTTCTASRSLRRLRRGMPALCGGLPRHGGSHGVKADEKGGWTMVRVKDFMTPQAEIISPDATAEDAASVMKTLDIGVLPVCDEEGLIGILTDRDLVV